MILARLLVCSSLLLGALALAASSASAQHAARGRIYELIVLEPGYSFPGGVNRSGRVAGSVADLASGGSMGFVWSASLGHVPLPPVVGTSSEARRINRHGFAVGQSHFDDSSSTRVATLWSPTGVAFRIPTIDLGQSQAYAINDSGVVVGSSRVGADQYESWVWDAVHGTRALHTLGLPPGGHAGDINASLQVCGRVLEGEAFVLDLVTSAVTWLGLLGGDWSNAARLSDRGHVVGAAGDPVDNAATPFLWTAEAGMRSLGTPAGPGFPVGWARGVNDRGTVVGWVKVSPDRTHAFVWDEELGMRDLNDVVRRRGEIVLTDAVDVSDTGWIVGQAQDNSVPGLTVTVGYVLKPL